MVSTHLKLDHLPKYGRWDKHIWTPNLDKCKAFVIWKLRKMTSLAVKCPSILRILDSDISLLLRDLIWGTQHPVASPGVWNPILKGSSLWPSMWSSHFNICWHFWLPLMYFLIPQHPGSISLAQKSKKCLPKNILNSHGEIKHNIKNGKFSTSQFGFTFLSWPDLKLVQHF